MQTFTIPVLFVLSLSVLATPALAENETEVAPIAETQRCALPLDTLVLDKDDRLSLEMLFAEAGADQDAIRPAPPSDAEIARSPLAAFKRTWMAGSLRRAERAVTSIHDLIYSHIAPEVPTEFSVVASTRLAIDAVNRGAIDLAWVRGDTLADSYPSERAHVRVIAYGRTYFDRLDEERYILVARRQDALGHWGELDTAGMRRAQTLVRQRNLKLAYGSLPAEALVPLHRAGIDPFSSESGLSPRVYIHRVPDDMNGIEELISGANGRPGVDLAAIDPELFRYYQDQMPGRSRFVVPIWSTPQFLLMARRGDATAFDLTSPETIDLLRRSRLGIYLDQKPAREAFVAALSATPAGKRALSRQAAMPELTATLSGEELLDDLVDGTGFDLALLQRRTFDSYREEKPGRARRLEIVATLPELPLPALIASDRFSETTREALQADLAAFDWKKDPFSSYFLLRGFTRFSFPQGETR